MSGDDIRKLPFLHIYAQADQHSDAEVRGTLEGLIALRDAIDMAIRDRDGSAKVIATDGEGYRAVVTRVNLIGLVGPLPYIEEPWPMHRHEAWRNPPDLSEWDAPTPTTGGEHGG